MNKSELIRLSIAQIGLVLTYNILTMNLQNFFVKTAFAGDPFANTLAFTVVTIAFGAGAFTYLISGWLSDRTVTRWGKRHPYLLFSIPGAIAFILLGLNFHPLSISYLLILLACLATAYTVTYRLSYTSYWSLYMDLTKPEDRVKSAITFNLFALIGIAIALIIPIPPEIVDPTSYSYFNITLIAGLVYIASIIFVFFFGPKENIEEIRKQHALKTEQPSVLSSIKETLKDENFRKYAISAFFASIFYYTAMFILKPFIEWKTEGRTPPIQIDFMIILLMLLPIALIIFYFCNWASKKWGKRTMYKRGTLIGFIAFPILTLLAAQGSSISLVIQLIILIVVMLSVVVIMLSYQNAILMDITPKGKEATYSGVFFFITVIPIPIASAIAGPILDIFTFDVLGFWIGQDFAYVILILIMSLALFLSFIFLRRVRYQEVL